MFRLAFLLMFMLSTPAFADTIWVATWNLGGFNAIRDSNLRQIERGISLLDVDVIVLPELNPLSAGVVIADALSEHSDCYTATSIDQPLARQEIGIIARCGIEVSQPGVVDGSDLGKQGYRNAAKVHVKAGNFDFVLLGLHLKAGRARSDRNLRSEQLEFIQDFVSDTIAAGEHDVLIIGDYNMVPGQDDENFSTLDSDGNIRFVSSEDLAGEFSHMGKEGSPGALLDGFAFTDTDAGEYVEGSLQIIPMHEWLNLSRKSYVAKVTDHLPIVAEFTTDVDND